jgi:hypothetical protein
MKHLLIPTVLLLILFSCDKTECLESNCNGAVPLYYQPVCGCNDITYPNWESAACHGILNYTKGECDSD